MSEEAVEIWLERNALWCESVGARLTPEQCAENRKRVRTEDVPILSRHCPGCPGISHQELHSEPSQPAPQEKPKPVSDLKKAEPATRRCTQCKRKLPQSSFRRSRITGNLLKRCSDCEQRATQSAGKKTEK